MTFYEEGTYKINVNETLRPILCDSLDGTLCEGTESNTPLDRTAKVGIEIKCQFNRTPLKNLVFYMPPERYVSQCLLEQRRTIANILVPRKYNCHSNVSEQKYY